MAIILGKVDAMHLWADQNLTLNRTCFLYRKMGQIGALLA